MSISEEDIHEIEMAIARSIPRLIAEVRSQAARIAELNEECGNAKEWRAEFSKAADRRYERIAELEASVRNQQGDNLCWFDGSPPIPPKAEFLESCRRYHDQIATQNGVLEGGRTIAQLEARVVELEAERLPLYSDRIANLEAERDALNLAVKQLEPRAAFGDQCYQDRCENAYVEQSVMRRLEAENATARKRLACPVCDGPVNACDCHPETG